MARCHHPRSRLVHSGLLTLNYKMFILPPWRFYFQVTLKNYDPQRDKRFSGTFKLPTIPR